MQGKEKRKATKRCTALGLAACISLTLAGCGGAGDVVLPSDRMESAGLCYGATLALAQERVGKGSVPLDDASGLVKRMGQAGFSVIEQIDEP